MQTTLLDLSKEMMPVALPAEVFTFRPFIKYVHELRAKSSHYKKAFLDMVLEAFDKYPELSGPVDVAAIKDYEALLNLVYTTLLPATEDEQDHYRALVMPIAPVVFYSSNDFYELAQASSKEMLNLKTRNRKEFERMRTEFCYILILEKYYRYCTPFHLNMNNILEDKQTGMTRAYKVKFDTRFIEVFADSLPELDLNKLDAIGHDKQTMLNLLMEKIPLSLFRFEGFRLMSLEDVTETYAIEEIKNQLLLRSATETDVLSAQVEHSLKMLLGKNDLELGLIPVFQVNNKFITDAESCMAGTENPEIAMSVEAAEKLESLLREVYLKKPKRIFFKEIADADAAKHFYLKILQQNGIKSYALVPIFYNEALAGILEIYTHKEDVLNLFTLAKLEPAMPFLSQLLQRGTEAFSNRIETIIKENFTSIQPSVQWKFNEAAWHYIRDQHRGEAPEIENIDFEKVYPLYGAIDIRNSTVARNEALVKDLKLQFALLFELMEGIRKQSGFSLVDAKLFAVAQWLGKINAPGGFYEQTELNDFLENDIHPFLDYFSKGNPEFAPDIAGYFVAMDPETGTATTHTRALEMSMNTVIATINNEVEEMSRKAQQAFPCFFEKFRTDGVEYDIYLGQSIAPAKAYNEIYLKNMRLLQLRSMAMIAQKTAALIPALQMPVETTQLIFIHAHPIDIKFRKDERRFDVEGAYNIRYQVIKKRIDKVYIKDTQERLTAPNKIALTYFNQKEADEYLSYIKYLQQEQLLTEEVEFLDLEPLQGVVGMKALRVSIRNSEK